MGAVDVGQQSIGWKFATPLQADYLNTFIAGLSSPGLLSRPKITKTLTGAGMEITIYPFSALVVPTDKKNTQVDENDNYPIIRLVKVTLGTYVTISASYSTVAIGFKYSFANSEGIPQTQWYGEFVLLNVEQLQTFDGIIIATVQVYETITPSGRERYCSITTSGADISDALLRDEGWDPNCWLSLVHPSRTLNGIYNMFEVRRHNARYNGYISGHEGFKRISNLTYHFDNTIHPEVNPENDRGFMPYNYNLFNIQSVGSGFSLCDGGDELPIEKVHGGVFAMVDASEVNLPPQGEGSNINSFSNRLKIHPVKQEDINIYADGNSLIIK